MPQFYKRKENMSKIILKIESENAKIYRDENICCYLVNSALSVDFIKSFADSDKMLLLYGENAPALCKSLNTDGLVWELDTSLPIKAQIIRIREIAGPRKILGTVIPPRRHEAMLVSETEPEFVVFKFSEADSAAALKVVGWYNELFLIQSAIDLSEGLQDVKAFEPDFVIINSADYENFGC